MYFFVGTLRHEGSHALAAILLGGDVTRFVFWPQRDLGFVTFGYVYYVGDRSWVVTAAPYIMDLVLFAVGVLLCRRLRNGPHWLWVNVLIFTALSSLLDSMWNYRPQEFPRNDVAALLHRLPDAIVHGWFFGTLALYAVGVLVIVGTIRPGERES